MPSLDNANINNVLQSLINRAGPKVSNAIYDASKKTGVNFAYMLEQAAAESNFKSDIKATTSSAQGLYQFIEKTWLNLVKKHGHKYGLEILSDKIDNNGHVKDSISKEQILKLRDDPKLSSFLAAEFAAENKEYLEKHTSAEVGPTELYLAHFLGAHGASAFLNSLKDNPLSIASDLFPKAANSNRNVFYNMKTGAPRTLSEIYDFFNQKFETSENYQKQEVKDSILSPNNNHYSHHPIFKNSQNNFMNLNVRPEPNSHPINSLNNLDLNKNLDQLSAYNKLSSQHLSLNLDLLIILSSWNDMSSTANKLIAD